MSETYLRAGPMINAAKTKILSASAHVAPTFSIYDKQLKNSENFIYLVSSLTFSCDLTDEIKRRIGLASSSFSLLSKRVLGSRSHRLHTKIAVYDAVVISTFLCGCESWVPCLRHFKLLESFHIRRLQLILVPRRWHKVTPSEIRSRAVIPSIESILLHRQLRFLGHVI